jgi:hypothetical protein
VDLGRDLNRKNVGFLACQTRLRLGLGPLGRQEQGPFFLCEVHASSLTKHFLIVYLVSHGHFEYVERPAKENGVTVAILSQSEI